MGIVAAAVVTLRAADEPAGERPGAPAAAGDASMVKAQAVYDELLRIAQDSRPDDPNRPRPEDFYTWSVRIDGGFAGDKGHRQRMQKGLKQAEARRKAGVASELELLAWQYYVAESDEWAARMTEHFESVEKMRDSIRNDPDLQQYLDAATRPSP